ncbi:hypothetical protein FALCPG4_018566 [Fusarium falciforme]
MVGPYILVTRTEWDEGYSHTIEGVVSILAASQLVGGFVSSLCYLFLARRPDLTFGDHAVDRENSSSIWNVLFFSWASDTLRNAAEKRSLESKDLPRLPNRTRSSHLHAQLEEALRTRGLLLALLSVHWRALVTQQLLTVATVCLSFAPQFSLFHILRCLEESNAASRMGALVWAMDLGGFMILSTVVESWLYWIVISRVGIPVREQLSAVIYCKAMRSHVNTKIKTKEEIQATEAEAEDSEKTTSRVSGHNPSNLVAVDAKRVSNEAAYSYTTVSIFVKLGVACLFLVSLLGWESTLVGFAVAMMLVPASVRISTQLSKSQAALMASRDKRIGAVGEALNGIREVKLRTQEGFWHTKISIIRRSELEAQWTCFLYDIGLLALCMLSPILLSIVCLGTYVMVKGPLTPSVAFTAIAAFGSLEVSFANLPGMASSMMEAYISLKRIENFLKADDFEPATTPSLRDGDFITFDGAAIAYSRDNDDNDDDVQLGGRFVLSGLSFSFPPGGLSIITGKTGSGKSLILSAILGECDVISGAVRVPPQLRMSSCPDYGTSQDDRTVKSRVGYVPQTPWIRNTTIRDNIVFGLPYCESRYRQTLAACDLELDVTEASRDRSVVTVKEVPHPERTDLGKETSAVGAVSMRVYKRYIKAGGNAWTWSFIIMAYISFMALSLARPWWVNLWTKSTSQGSETTSLFGQEFQQLGISVTQNLHDWRSDSTGHLAYYLSIYVLISFLSCLAGSLRFFLILSASIRASRSLFEGLLYAVFHAPITWFDNVPVGRVINRFAADMSLVDSDLSYDMGAFLHRLFEVISIAVSGMVASPLTLIFSLIPAVGACYYAPRYLAAARQMKRLESAAISPVLEQLGSSISGLATIRAFANVNLYVSSMHSLIDQHGQTSWHLWLFNRWFNLRMNLTGAIYCVLTAMSVILLPGLEVSVIGFVISFAIQYPAALLWTVRQYTNVELSMSSAERVAEYENINLENQEGDDAPDTWPESGKVEVRDLSLGYGQLPPVLKDVSFTIEAGQRVGVVGRTGAGKSSLTLGLFRFLEAHSAPLGR